jgi:hypothetical protein
MVLSNAPKKVTNISSLVNQNQGGGSKKAGFPYIVGRTSWSVIYLQSNCKENSCSLASLRRNALIYTVNQSRPVGSDPRIPMR